MRSRTIRSVVCCIAACGMHSVAAFGQIESPRGDEDRTPRFNETKLADGNALVLHGPNGERPENKPVKSSGRGGQTAYLGVAPDYMADVVGVQIKSTTSESPAAKAGLKEGDVIVQFGTVPSSGPTEPSAN